MASDETARATARVGRAVRRALGERRARLQVHNRMKHNGGRNALSLVVKAAARQQQENEDRGEPSHLVQ